MPKFRYVARPTTGDWVEFFHHMPELHVKGGVTETDDPLAIDYLLLNGYEQIPEPAVEKKKKSEPTSRARRGRTRR